MYKLLLALVLIVSAAVLPSTARAAECTEVSAVGTTLSLPGSYCLSANLTANATSGNFLAIGSSDIVLDCRGYSLHNVSIADNGDAIGIYMGNVSNVTIRNCRITGGFMAAIYAYQNNGNYNFNQALDFSGNTIYGAKMYGIFVYGTDVTLRDNRIHDIGGRANFAMGIRVGGSTYPGQSRSFLVTGNYITGVSSPVNNAYGIYGNNPQASTFDDNVIIGTTADNGGYGAWGIFLSGGSYNRLRGNRIVGNLALPNDGGISTSSATGTDECWDNHVRGATSIIVNCDTTHGNF